MPYWTSRRIGPLGVKGGTSRVVEGREGGEGRFSPLPKSKVGTATMGEAKSVRVMGHRHAISKPLPPYAILTLPRTTPNPPPSRHAPSPPVQGVAL